MFIGSLKIKDKNGFKKIENLINDNPSIKWLFYGDSITQGSLHTSGAIQNFSLSGYGMSLIVRWTP